MLKKRSLRNYLRLIVSRILSLCLILIMNCTAFAGGGGMDGGGGGSFLFYRASLAKDFIVEMLKKIEPKDLPPSLRSTFKNHKFFMIEDFAKTEVKVLNQKSYSQNIFTDRSPVSDLILVQNFWDHTLTRQGTFRMGSLAYTILFVLLNHVPLQDEKTKYELLNGLWDAAEKIGLTAKIHTFFSFGDENVMSLNEFIAMKEKSARAFDFYNERLLPAKRWAAKLISRSAKHSLSFERALSQMKIAQELKPSSGWNDFYELQGHNGSEYVEFTEAIRHASFDELVFLILHEAGHGVFGNSLLTENKINQIVAKPVMDALKNDLEFQAQIKFDKNLIAESRRFELENKSEKWWTFTDLHISDRPLFYLQFNSVAETWDQKSIDARLNRSLHLCRYLGFEESITSEKLVVANSTETVEITEDLKVRNRSSAQGELWVFKSITCK
ncbi:MAG: hypothetical protein AABY64_13195 [Bdellovibrionota bacterium]